AHFGPGRALLLWGDSSQRHQLWDLSGDQPALRFKEEQERIHHYHFRPDGKLLAVSHQDGSINVYDVSTGARVHRLEPSEIVRTARVRLHPTGPFVAVNSYLHRLVQVRDLRTGAVVARFEPPWRGNGGFAWAPDGRTL